MKLELGQKLYNRDWFLKNEYEVIGERKYKQSTYYEIRGLSCNDHEPCEVLINYDKKLKCFRYIEDLNQECEDYRPYNETNYYTSEIEAEKHFLKICLSKARENLRKTLNTLENEKKRVSELEIALDLINKTNPTTN